MNIIKFVDILKENGVKFNILGRKGKILVGEIGFVSPGGRNFREILYFNDEDSIVDNFRRMAKEFDPDDDAARLISLRGGNRISNSIRDIIDDSDNIKEKLLDIAQKVIAANEEEKATNKEYVFTKYQEWNNYKEEKEFPDLKSAVQEFICTVKNECGGCFPVNPCFTEKKLPFLIVTGDQGRCFYSIKKIRREREKAKYSYISLLCYELYKLDWKREYKITHEREMKELKKYYKEYSDEYSKYIDYIKDNGYNDNLYAPLDIFLHTKYLDIKYIENLLSDEDLIEEYKADIR